jgi:hypothetical protein
VNLELAYRLLIAAGKHSEGGLKVHDREAAREVQLMIDAGLIEGSGPSEFDLYSATINSVTEAGQKFLRGVGNLPKATGHPET